jgi:hypothetical protein
LLCEEVSLVAKYTHAEPSAWEYLHDRLHRCEIPWSFDKLEFNFRGRAAPESDWIRIGQLFFRRRHISAQHEVDVVNSSATRTGAGILGIRLDGKGNLEPIYESSRASLTMRATLIRLHHPTVVQFLQRSRLMPSPLALVPAMEVAPEQTSPAKKWQPEEAKGWLSDYQTAHPLWGQNKNAWARQAYVQMQKDFGAAIPWNDWQTLRRRLND